MEINQAALEGRISLIPGIFSGSVVSIISIESKDNNTLSGMMLK
jgi:hypothetical protein